MEERRRKQGKARIRLDSGWNSLATGQRLPRAAAGQEAGASTWGTRAEETPR